MEMGLGSGLDAVSMPRRSIRWPIPDGKFGVADPYSPTFTSTTTG